jgi:lysyl-tRNA synthetase class 2
MSNTFDELVQNRRKKLEALRESNSAYPNDFKASTTIEAFNQVFQDKTQEELETNNEVHSIGGRIKLHRVMGKTSFCHISDEGGSLQLYLKRENEEGDGGIPRNQYNPFKKFDLGDIIGVTGVTYRTNKGELSLKVKSIKLLAKSLLPLPDKHHGLADQEMRWRQRYVDLIVNEDSMETFRKRSRIVGAIREFMESGSFTEVETPMMHPIPGGATARPFITHHNTLDMDLYLRIAPELYLKRLIVGGFRKVYEINRNFRNEGLSPKHNPEFTMMEFYSAFWDYHDLMNFTECLIQYVTEKVLGKNTLPYGEQQLDFGQDFQVMTMKESVLDRCHWVTAEDLSSLEAAQECWLRSGNPDGSIVWARDEKTIPKSIGEIVAWLFEEYVEHQLIQPTFITQFPVEISPLARRNDDDPTVTDRFELFIAGQEIANGFSELNDPDDQAERFKAQVAALESGDKEAMHYDEDYITALQYGMPPTAGEGIGIDRLVAILLNKANIRDVILFPQMRPNVKSS